MPSRSRFRVLLAALASLSLVLAACGGDTTPTAADPVPAPADDAPDEDAAPAPGDETTESGEAAPEPEAEPAPAPAPEPEPASGDGDCSAQGEQVTMAPAPDLPDEVAALREFLMDAALRCDEQLLFTAIEESEQFTYSFGAEGDAIGHWWQLEEAGEEPFLRLAQVLATTTALADGDEVYVWPRVTTGRAQDTTDEAWAEVTWMEQPEQTAQDSGGYLGWRVGISNDGEWRFFVAGD
jgi:hypothetical protein